MYVSSAVSLLSDEALEGLLAGARGFNEKVGVTGVLFYTGGAFFQYFEGSPDSVTQVYERIAANRRHHSIRVLLDRRIGKRLFPDWLMGVSHTTDSEILRLNSAQWNNRARKQGTAADDDSPGLALLRTFWEDNQDVG